MIWYKNFRIEIKFMYIFFGLAFLATAVAMTCLLFVKSPTCMESCDSHLFLITFVVLFSVLTMVGLAYFSVRHRAAIAQISGQQQILGSKSSTVAATVAAETTTGEQQQQQQLPLPLTQAAAVIQGAVQRLAGTSNNSGTGTPVQEKQQPQGEGGGNRATRVPLHSNPGVLVPSEI
jgi:hypothetical protein